MGDESDLILALRRAAGVADKDTFSVTVGDVTILVNYSGGSSSSLTLSVDYDRVARALPPDGRATGYRASAVSAPLSAVRPLRIKLRREQAADREAKSEGIAREHQTGDPAFDERVYIDSPTTDAGVLSAVLGSSTRSGALALLDLGFHSIELDTMTGKVTADLSTFASRTPSETRAHEMLSAFAKLAGELPVVRASGGAHPGNGLRTFNVLAGIAVAVGGLGAIPGYFAVASAHDCTEPSSDGEGTSLKPGCSGPGGMALAVGLVFGLLVALAVRPPLTARFRGQSDSHSQIGRATMLVFGLVFLACFFAVSIALFANR